MTRPADHLFPAPEPTMAAPTPCSQLRKKYRDEEGHLRVVISCANEWAITTGAAGGLETPVLLSRIAEAWTPVDDTPAVIRDPFTITKVLTHGWCSSPEFSSVDGPQIVIHPDHTWSER